MPVHYYERDNTATEIINQHLQTIDHYRQMLRQIRDQLAKRERFITTLWCLITAQWIIIILLWCRIFQWI